MLGYNGGNQGVFTQTCSFKKDYFNHLVDSRTDKYENFPQVHFENGISYHSGSVSALAHIDPVSKITRPFEGEMGRSVLGDYTTIPMFEGDVYKYDSAVLGVDLTCEYDDAYKTASLYAIVDFSNIGVDTSQTPGLRASSRKVWIGTYDLQGDNKVFGIWAGNKTWLQSAQFEYAVQEPTACKHEFVDKMTREAECNKEGRIRHTCQICGYEYEESVKANEHKFWDKDLEDGTRIRSCQNCELSFVTTDPVKYECEHEYTEAEKVAATQTQTGYIKYTCRYCGDTYTEVLDVIPKEDSKENSKENPKENPKAEPVIDEMQQCTQAILNTNTDKGDVKGSTFAPLFLKATGKNKSVKLAWKKVKKADGYIVYGVQCGKKMKEIKKLGASTKSYTQKKLKKAKYYKYMVVAYKKENGKQIPIAISTSVHTATSGGKYASPTKVTIKAKTITLKKGKSKKIKASYKLPKGKKTKTHIAKFRYESTNKKVVTVSKKGKLKAKKKGTAYIYVYAQNGVFAKIKVKVK